MEIYNAKTITQMQIFSISTLFSYIFPIGNLINSEYVMRIISSYTYFKYRFLKMLPYKNKIGKNSKVFANNPSEYNF